jgi:hypothetical protein
MFPATGPVGQSAKLFSDDPPFPPLFTAPICQKSAIILSFQT